MKYKNSWKEIIIDREGLKRYGNKTLYVYIENNTKTVNIMDKFESTTEDGFKKYDQMIFVNYSYTPKVGFFHMVVKRAIAKQCVGDITMTKFKRHEDQDLCKYVDDEMEYYKEKHLCKKGKYIPFRKPYLLRAQNTRNRRGYGNIYNGESLIYEGTLYGDTIDYAFMGIILSDS